LEIELHFNLLAMKYKVYFLGLVLIMWISACKKDENSIHPINIVTIESDVTSFEVTQLDSLHVPLKLSESLATNGDSYTYQWKAYKVSGNSTVISTKKELDERISLPSGNYEMEFRVKNSKTGVETLALFQLIVNSAFSEGWLISHNKDGKANFSFLRVDDELFMHPAEDVNQMEFHGKAIGAFGKVDYKFALTYFFTDKEIYRFDAEQFLLNGTTKDIVSDVSQIDNQGVNFNLSHGGYDQILIFNNGIHMGISGSFPFETDIDKKLFSDRLTGDYFIYPEVISTYYNETYFYDNKYKKFLRVQSLGRDLYLPQYRVTDAFDMRDVGKTLKQVAYGSRDYFSNQAYFLMQDASGYYLYELLGNIPKSVQKLDNIADVDKIVSMAGSASVRHIYYATENSIYLYDFLAQSSRLLYTFPADVKVNSIKMWQAYSGNPYNNKRLVVAANSGNNGSIYYFDLESTGLFKNNAISKQIDGFGNIAGISFKNKY